MVNYTLPKSIEVEGTTYEIRSDYRAILDIISAMNDPDLNGAERAVILLDIFYPAFNEMPRTAWQEAVDKAIEFIACEKRQNTGGLKLVDWEQDFQYIVAPINAVAGKDVREAEYLHWWSFLGYYGEISDKSTFSQIVRIRDALKRGKMDKADREWYAKNRDLVDMKVTYTEAEEKLLAEWGV